METPINLENYYTAEQALERINCIDLDMLEEWFKGKSILQNGIWYIRKDIFDKIFANHREEVLMYRNSIKRNHRTIYTNSTQPNKPKTK